MNENARFVQTETQVVVVGAGPTGLLLAGDLAARGIECIVLERRADPPDPTTTRAFAVHARTLEQLDARGLADRLIGTGTLVDQFRLFGKPAVSFKRLPSRFPYLLVTPQYNVERLLEERAVGAGAQVLRGMEAVALSQDSDGVSVTVRPKEASDHAGDSVFRAQYVVGADGVHSVVRAALGLPYPGRCVVRSLMLADVRLAQEPSEVLTVGAVGDAFAFLAPFGGGWYRAFCWNRRHQVAPSEPVELSEVREVLVRSLGSDFGLSEARWLSRFQSDERQVPAYRVGRVFLAGDAAHCHSPAGGQGMNTGLQDAANLGWKLAAALRGRSAAGERLLDSYHAERHPVGRQVLRSSGALVRLALLRSWPARQARDLFGETVMRVPAVERRLTGTVSGVAIEYDRPHGAHPSVGRRVPDLLLAAGGSARSESEPKIGAGRLYERLRDGRFLLVGRDEQDIASAQDWADEVGCAVSAESPCALMLVRPDAYVAWASDEADSAARTGAAREALLEWCGPVPVRPA